MRERGEKHFTTDAPKKKNMCNEYHKETNKIDGFYEHANCFNARIHARIIIIDAFACDYDDILTGAQNRN